MPLVSHLSHILLLMCLVQSQITAASPDFHTEDIRPSMSDNVYVPAAATAAKGSSTNSLTASGSTQSSQRSDITTFNTINSDSHSMTYDGVTSSAITHYIWSSTNVDPAASSGIKDPLDSTTYVDSMMSSAITDFTESLANSDGVTSTATKDSLYSVSNDDIMKSSAVNHSLSSSTIADQKPISTTVFSRPSGSVASDTAQFSTTHGAATLSSRSYTTLAIPSGDPEVLVVTGSTYLLLGEDLELTCQIPDQYLSNYTATNITFKHSHPFEPQSSWDCMPNTSIQINNETAAKLIVSNVTFNDSGQYTCFVGDTLCQFGFNCTSPALFGYVDDVSIEYTPQAVTDIQCEVVNWDESMTCGWQHPVQYQDWSNIEVTLTFSITSRDPNITCPNQTPTECRWLDFIAADVIYKIEVRVTNRPKQQTASTPFKFKVFKHIKPAPIENLSITSERPGCLVISWTHPRLNRSKVYRIKHKNVTDGQNISDNWIVLVDNLTNNHYNSCEHNASEFHPYTHYNFSVDCLPSGNYAGYFSDPVSQDFWTPMAAPTLGPSATNGSFTSTPCLDRHRNVTVMWQTVDPEAQNGIITGYEIRSGHDSWTSTTFSATVILTCDTVFVAIFAFNEEGFSASPTILLISTTTVSKAVQNSFVVEIVNMNSTEMLQASWQEAEEVEGEVDYTIFWCKGRLEQSCEGEIQWREVPAGDTVFSIPIESSHAIEYIYGISGTNTHMGIASSVFWTPCLFRRVPSTLPPVSTMNVKSLESSVYITWSADSCFYQSQIRYTSFVVKWCQTDACNDASQVANATVPVKQSTYTVSSLPAGINYSFTVQPVSYNTAGREVDPWKVAVPSATDPVADSMLPVKAALGGLACGALVICICIYCQKRRAKINKFGDTSMLHLPDRAVPELGHPLNDLESVASQNVQQNRPTFIEDSNYISLSSESDSVQGQESGLLEHNSTIKDLGYRPNPNMLSSETEPHARPASNGYSRFMGSESIHEDHNNVQSQDSRQTEQNTQVDLENTLGSCLVSSDKGSHTRSASNSYSRIAGNEPEVSNNAEAHRPRQAEDFPSVDPGYMPHQGFLSSDNESPASSVSNSYSRVTGNEPQVCNNAEAHRPRQAEKASTSTDPGYMPHEGFLSSDNESPASSVSNSYSRVTGIEPKVCNNAEAHRPRQAEKASTSTDTGYMPHPSFASSDRSSDAESPPNSYSRVTGDELQVGYSHDEFNNNAGAYISRESEEYSALRDASCMPHQSYLPSDNDWHTDTETPSNNCSRITENEHEVNGSIKGRMSRQSEDATSIDPGYMAHQDFPSSDNDSHTRLQTNNYSRVARNESEVCNKIEDNSSRQSEKYSLSTDAGYMPCPGLLSSDKDDVYTESASAPPETSSMVALDSNISMSDINDALWGDYNQEEETYQEKFYKLTSMVSGDDNVTDKISFEETLV